MKFVFTILFLCFNVFSQAQPFELKPHDVIALTGGSNMERTRFNGYLQTNLISSKPELKIKVRNFGWEGDTVFEQWRDGGNYQNLDPKRAQAEKRISAETGTDSWRQQRDWKQQLSEVGATVVIAQFGQMESLNGMEKLPQFIEAYERLIAEFADEGRRVVLVSPVPFEGERIASETVTAAYKKAIQELSTRLLLPFIDVEESFRVLSVFHKTEDGFHLTDKGHSALARIIALGLGIKDPRDDETIRTS
jgi:lysophospholipase L1-like esterase